MRRTAGERTSAPVDFCFDSGTSFDSFPIDFVFFSTASVFFSVGAAFSGATLESSMIATISPIFTSWPSAAFVSSTPAFSATISVETLSVSRVKSASPGLTKSPDFLCQTETTPLEIDSPTAGTLMSIAILVFGKPQVFAKPRAAMRARVSV